MSRKCYQHVFRALLLVALLATVPAARAFTSCPPIATTVSGFTVFQPNCVTGHYFITLVGLAQLGLPLEAQKAIANANIGVDSYESGIVPANYGHNCSGTVQPFELTNKLPYMAGHHFDRKGSFETTSFAFVRGAQYLMDRRNAFIAAIQSAQTCQDVANALVILGQALHALQDVFSHSNYVDLDVLDQISVQSSLDTATVPPNNFVLTGFDPSQPDDELPLGDLYPHCLKAKDFPHKNPESDLPDPHDTSVSPQTKYEAAKGYAIVATGDFVQAVANQLGIDWAKVQRFGTPGSMCSATNLHPVQIITSGDPNDKTGPIGVGSKQYLAGNRPINYGIFYGNEPTASASAQTVAIIDMLPITKVDLATFAFGPIAFGSQLLLPPPGTSYSTTVDLRPQSNLLVGIAASLNPQTGQVTWKFSSLDPSTGNPTTDPSAGFLPIGGNGSVLFSVAPKTGVVTDAQVQNQATVIFDNNPAINTPTWSNAFDNTLPVTTMTSLAATQATSCFRVGWAGSDVGSGIQNFNIFVSDNAAPYTAWMSQTSLANAIFNGQPGHSYAFYAQAIDLVGNTEHAKAAADTQTLLPPNVTCNGTPSISGKVISNTQTDASMVVVIQLTNNGVGDSQAISLNALNFRTVAGSGVVTEISPPVPILLGGLSAASSTTVTLTLAVPSTVKQFSITESGSLLDSSGNRAGFSVGQSIIP